jgi:alkylhydroperoxidase/carboxymuconolactone decarboxylase family protein YurZ
MDDRERYAQGLATRRAVLGDAHVDRALAQTTAGGEAFQDLLTRYVWGEIWTRPGLDVRSRRLLVLATLIATGRWDEFRLHAGAALREGGFTMQELTEIILQQAIYCGVPTARHAFGVLTELEESPTQTEE